MAEFSTIVLPPAIFTAATQLAAKKSYDLYATAEKPNGVLPIGYVTPPAEGFIVRECHVVRELPTPPSAASLGKVDVAIDLQRDYCDETTFPVAEFGYPRNPCHLGFVRLEVGTQPDLTFKHYDLAKWYRPGDRIIVAPVVNGGADSYIVLATLGLELPFRIQRAPGVVMAEPLNYGAAGGAPTTYRTLISKIRTNGPKSQIRVVCSTLGAPCTITSMAVGIQASGPNMTTVPVPVTFNGGNAGVTIAAHDYIKADPANCPVNDGDSVLVDIQIAPSSPWALRGLKPITGCDEARDPTWYSSANGHALQNLSGASVQENTRQVVCALEVL